MQLSSIIMSRVIGIAALGETNPFGRIFLPDLIPHLVAKYRFQKYPSSIADIKASEGTVFEMGYAEECGTISKLVAYNDGLTIETRAHSGNATSALIGIYEWLAKEHGITYGPNTVKRWLYVTDLLFYSEADLTSLNPALQPVCDAMSAYNCSIGREGIEFRASRIAIDYDHSVFEFPQTQFLIERDKTARFSEGKYFSESPFPSEQHIKILEALEMGILNK